jgi:hypothetical protein
MFDGSCILSTENNMLSFFSGFSSENSDSTEMNGDKKIPIRTAASQNGRQ